MSSRLACWRTEFLVAPCRRILPNLEPFSTLLALALPIFSVAFDGLGELEPHGSDEAIRTDAHDQLSFASMPEELRRDLVLNEL